MGGKRGRKKTKQKMKNSTHAGASHSVSLADITNQSPYSFLVSPEASSELRAALQASPYWHLRFSSPGQPCLGLCLTGMAQTLPGVWGRVPAAAGGVEAGGGLAPQT